MLRAPVELKNSTIPPSYAFEYPAGDVISYESAWASLFPASSFEERASLLTVMARKLPEIAFEREEETQ